MSSGYGANFSYTMSVENMEKILPVEMGKLNDAIDNAGVDLDLVFRSVAYGWDDVDEYKDILTSVKEIEEAFKKITSLNGKSLELEFGFHDSNDCGDIYDDVNGPFFYIYNVVEETEQAKKFKEFIKASAWVTFG